MFNTTANRLAYPSTFRRRREPGCLPWCPRASDVGDLGPGTRPVSRCSCVPSAVQRPASRCSVLRAESNAAELRRRPSSYACVVSGKLFYSSHFRRRDYSGLFVLVLVVKKLAAINLLLSLPSPSSSLLHSSTPTPPPPATSHRHIPVQQGLQQRRPPRRLVARPRAVWWATTSWNR